ncbi:MAG TPA: hypothetical protein VFC19_44360, partial [Candidatus Limnocylindrales bacterium]|nr:hypothetical protein [Candidatus Limnocylindrales bacterium]
MNRIMLKRIAALRHKKASFLRRRAWGIVRGAFPDPALWSGRHHHGPEIERAGALYDSVGAEGLSGRERPLALAALVKRGDVLEAFDLLAGTDAVSVVTFRALRDGLSERGYLLRARSVARRLPGRRDAWIQSLLEGEIAVLSGEFEPPVVAPPQGFTPEPGRVLHLVGSSLPYVQSGYTLRTHYTVLAQQEAGLDPHVVTQLGFGFYGVDVIDGVLYHRLAGQGRGTEPLDVWLSAHVRAVADVVSRVCPSVLHAAS